MGEEKQRKQRLGVNYGEKPEAFCPESAGYGNVDAYRFITNVQDYANADNKPKCASGLFRVDGKKDVFVANNEIEIDGTSPLWVPPMREGEKPKFCHPVCVRRSNMTGKWLVVILLSEFRQLAVFNQLKHALRCAQNAQYVYGKYTPVIASGSRFSRAALECGMLNDADGLPRFDGMLYPLHVEDLPF